MSGDESPIPIDFYERVGRPFPENGEGSDHADAYTAAYDRTIERPDVLPRVVQDIFIALCCFVFWPVLLPMIVKELV